MKTTKLLRSVICLLLVFAMAFLATGCKDSGDDSSDYTYSEYWIEEEIAEEDDGATDTDTTSSSGGSTTTSSGGGTTTSTPEKNSLKGKTIKMLLRYEMPERESSVVDAFTKKTGAKVQLIKTSMSNYQTKLAS